VDREGRTIWIAYEHRSRQRFIVHADEKFTAFLNWNRQFALAVN
jgi:hypothetical protein